MKVEKEYFKSIILFLCLVFVTLTSYAGNEKEQIIQEPISQLHEALINLMVIANSTNYEDRYKYLEPIIENNFDMDLISKVVLSRYWKTIDEKNKIKFVDLFKKLTISTYVSRFNSYDNQIFKNISIDQLKENRFFVKTEFKKSGKNPISFNYIVQENNEKWRIISVIANGVNDLSLKRAEYASIIKKDGFDALISKLEQKIDDSQTN